MNRIIRQMSWLAVFSMALLACKKDNETNLSDTYTVPATYDFANVNYSGQTTRLAMLEEILFWCDSAKTGYVVDAQFLKEMFANTNSHFSDTTLNNSGKQLKDKCYVNDQALIETYFDSVATASASGVAGADGVAGVVISTNDPNKKYCLSANGFDYMEMIEKGVMGSCFYYQAINTYLDGIALDDNTNVVAGEGTAMEHHFDEAFGYFGVPVDFPTNIADALFWGEYCNELNSVLSSNNMMNYFLTARAAISNKDYGVRDANLNTIISRWDILAAAAAIHELNEAATYFSDDAIRNHVLTEAVGFINTLKYNLHAVINATQTNDVLNLIGNNLYQVTLPNIISSRDMLSSIYSLDSVKTIL